jgi:hypothetical protein
MQRKKPKTYSLINRLLAGLLFTALPSCATSQTQMSFTVRRGEPEFTITTVSQPYTRDPIGLENTHTRPNRLGRIDAHLR